jgi:hypothetical protein
VAFYAACFATCPRMPRIIVCSEPDLLKRSPPSSLQPPAYAERRGMGGRSFAKRRFFENET